MWTRRDLLKMALAAPAGAWLANFQTLAAPARGAVKITAVKALQLDFQGDGCLVRIETDAGITGYGETGVDVKMARARIPQYRLVGADPLSIERHFQSMTGGIHPFLPSIPLISGIDIALWDLAGKILDLPVCKLMGGPQRSTVPMYSHGDAIKDMSSPASCKEWAQTIREQPEGFSAYKIEPRQGLAGERTMGVGSLLYAEKPSGCSRIVCAHSLQDAGLLMSLMASQCEYMGTVLRCGPPISLQTGRSRILPARSHSAMSMPLISGMLGRNG